MNLKLTPDPVKNKILELEGQILARDLIILKLTRVQRRTLRQMRVAARKLKDPKAVAIIESIDREFKEIQQLTGNVKRNARRSRRNR